MSLVNKTSVKEKSEFQISEDFYAELEKTVENLVKKAESRARANNRRTIFARDI